MNMARIYDSRGKLLRTYLALKRLLADQMAADPQLTPAWLIRLVRRYGYKARHRQDRSQTQYRVNRETGDKVTYQLEPSLRDRIRSVRRSRTVKPLANAWHETGQYPALLNDETFVGSLLWTQKEAIEAGPLDPYAARAVVPVVMPSEDEATQRRAIHEALTARNNATLILTGAEGPMAP